MKNNTQSQKTGSGAFADLQPALLQRNLTFFYLEDRDHVLEWKGHRLLLVPAGDGFFRLTDYDGNLGPMFDTFGGLAEMLGDLGEPPTDGCDCDDRGNGQYHIPTCNKGYYIQPSKHTLANIGVRAADLRR